MRLAVLQATAAAIPLPDESVHCVVTSPPYWGLRKYDGQGEEQLGLERTPGEYVENLVAIFREVRRALRSDGVAWLNLGDSYAASRSYQVADSKWREVGNDRASKVPPGLKPGDLCGIPWSVAFALRDDGWYLRRDQIWSKPNPMPESVDGWRWERCRVKVRSMPPVDEWPQAAAHGTGNRQRRPNSGGVPFPGFTTEWRPCPGCPKCSPNDGLVLRRGSWRTTSAHEYVFLLAKSRRYFSNAEGVREADQGTDHRHRNVLCGQDSLEPSGGVSGPHTGIRKTKGRNGAGRNPRSVWTFTTRPFPGAHFATFPPDLPDFCIRASTAEKVCGECGAPWAAVVERAVSGDHGRGTDGTSEARGNDRAMLNGSDYYARPATSTVLDHRPTCPCSADSTAATVLDPFGGSGTTARAARALGRRAVSLDLSLAYCAMARERAGEACLDTRERSPRKMAAIGGPLFS